MGKDGGHEELASGQNTRPAPAFLKLINRHVEIETTASHEVASLECDALLICRALPGVFVEGWGYREVRSQSHIRKPSGYASKKGLLGRLLAG